MMFFRCSLGSWFVLVRFIYEGCFDLKTREKMRVYVFVERDGLEDGFRERE